MPSFVQTLPSEAESPSVIAAAERPRAVDGVKVSDPRNLLLAVLTTSAYAHILIVGFLGRGLPADLPRPKPLPAAPPAKVIENVRLEAPPPPPPPKALRDLPPSPPVDLPNLEPAAAIPAVPSTVKVDFAIRAVGPVHIVNSIGEAAARAEPISEGPISLDSGSAEGALLAPPLTYPPEALRRHQTGVVVLEFMTTATGDITGARVLRSSGHGSLDRDALEKLRQSRWTGRAGHFTKTYDYTLILR
jgi:TonB family protein